MMPATSSAPVLSQVRQAYVGRRVTITVILAGTLSSRLEVSSPIRCSSPPQHGQTLLSGSITTSSCGRWSSFSLRLARRFLAAAAFRSGSAFSASALAFAAAVSSSSRVSASWSSVMRSDLRPNCARFSSATMCSASR
jgi:hypothetical protein